MQLTCLEECEDSGVQWFGMLEASRQFLNGNVRVTDNDAFVVGELGSSEIIANVRR